MTNPMLLNPLYHRRVKQALGCWLSGFQWDYFATLTTKEDMSFAQIRGALGRWFGKINRRGVNPYFWASEIGRFGRVHAHALIATSLTVTRIKTTWSVGHANIVSYDPARGAAYYLAKSITQERSDFDLSDVFPSSKVNRWEACE